MHGMRPGLHGDEDMCCIQSREVWTGTTCGLAATMLHEAVQFEHTLKISDNASDTDSVRAELLERALELRTMTFNTAKGIHDGDGKSLTVGSTHRKAGNYRSLLAIWAMQYCAEVSYSDAE